MTIARNQNISFWTSVKHGFPLLCLLMGDFITFTKPTKDGSGMFMDAETYRLLIFGGIYLLSAWVIYLRRVDFLALMRGHWIYTLFLLYAFSSLLWSANPGKTVITCGHLLGHYLVATAGLLLFRGNEVSLLRVYCMFSYAFIPACLVTAFLFPERNIHTTTGRWMALTWNPNALGGAAMISVWANMSYLLYTRTKLMRMWTVMNLVGAFILLVGAGSVTSLGLSVFIVFCVPLFYWFANSQNVITAAFKIGYTSLIIFGLLGYFYATQPELFEPNRVLGAVDRDTNLTGRSTLWEIAWKAIGDKFWFGWSFDALNSLPTKYKISYNQFHNGYLDVMVRGGVVALFFIILFSITTAFRIIWLARTNKLLVASFGTLQAVILLHNASESSFASAPNPLWLLFTFLYIGVSPRIVKWYETGILEKVKPWNWSVVTHRSVPAHKETAVAQMISTTNKRANPHARIKS
jgi:exopolysaccharide production protein ExoQ